MQLRIFNTYVNNLKVLQTQSLVGHVVPGVLWPISHSMWLTLLDELEGLLTKWDHKNKVQPGVVLFSRCRYHNDTGYRNLFYKGHNSSFKLLLSNFILQKGIRIKPWSSILPCSSRIYLNASCLSDITRQARHYQHYEGWTLFYENSFCFSMHIWLLVTWMNTLYTRYKSTFFYHQCQTHVF